MAIAFKEAFRDDAFKMVGGYDPSAAIPWIATASAGETEEQVINAALAPTSPIPAVFGILTLRTVEHAGVLHTSGAGVPDAWKLLAQYDYISADYEFETVGGQQHITTSITTIGRYGPSASMQLAGTIGWDGNDVQGCDIISPVYNFSETHRFTDLVVTPAYKATLFRLTGKVNSDPFRGFEAGEVLFLGASGRRVANNMWEVGFKFSSLPNHSSANGNLITIGSITGVAKKGWEYLWVQYADDVDSTAKVMVRRPVAVYVEQVYYTAAFSGLGI